MSTSAGPDQLQPGAERGPAGRQRAPESVDGSTAGDRAPGWASDVLLLQRAVGNRATTTALGATTIQRQMGSAQPHWLELARRLRQGAVQQVTELDTAIRTASGPTPTVPPGSWNRVKNTTAPEVEVGGSESESEEGGGSSSTSTSGGGTGVQIGSWNRVKNTSDVTTESI